MGGQRGYGAGGVWGLRCRVGVWMRMERGKLQQVWGYGCVVGTYREWGGGGHPSGIGIPALRGWVGVPLPQWGPHGVDMLWDGGPTASMGVPWSRYPIRWGSHCCNGGLMGWISYRVGVPLPQ